MSIFQVFKRVFGYEVETKPQIDHCAHDEGATDAIPALLLLDGEFPRPMGIGLPEIHARPKPVIVAVAWRQRSRS